LPFGFVFGLVFGWIFLTEGFFFVTGFFFGAGVATRGVLRAGILRAVLRRALTQSPTSEALWRAGIRPTKPAGKVTGPQLARLVPAIREIRAGGVPMSRTIARKVIETFRSREAAEAAGTSAARSPAASLDEESLTSREQQVLELLVEGFSYKEISQRLGISTSTVGTYVQRIYEKLHVSSRREIMARRRPARG
jgi:DNA-binding NarL/FixJ family response regulator